VLGLSRGALLIGCVAATLLAMAAFALTRPDGAPHQAPLVFGRTPGTKRSGPASNAATRGSIVASLTAAQLAGQRIIYAYHGLTPPDSLLARIRAGQAAGVIFFGSNIVNLSQLRAAITKLQTANASSPVHAPLLMLTDQEGGLVRRLPGAPALSEREIGAGANPLGLARTAGRGAGANLAHAAINVNLAPVLDVYRRPGDFIDEFDRSYGSAPLAVGSLGAAFISAQQARGIAATAKHFPGLGAAETGQNTDQHPVVLDTPLHTLRVVDELPYREALAAGVRLVMMSWATYPALDQRLPAGLSPTVIQSELRGRIGFRGVTITDGIGAGALVHFGSDASRGLLAAQAGADLLLCSAPNVSEDSPAEGESVLRELATALSSARLSRSSAEAAAERNLALRSSP
jgi:beta-N-acetylhexosaminidase